MNKSVTFRCKDYQKISRLIVAVQVWVSGCLRSGEGRAKRLELFVSRHVSNDFKGPKTSVDPKWIKGHIFREAGTSDRPCCFNWLVVAQVATRQNRAGKTWKLWKRQTRKQWKPVLARNEKARLRACHSFWHLHVEGGVVVPRKSSVYLMSSYKYVVFLGFRSAILINTIHAIDVITASNFFDT